MTILWDGTGSEDGEQPLLCKELSSSQRQELTHLLQEFADVSLVAAPAEHKLQSAASELGPQRPSDFLPTDYPTPTAT